MPLTANAYPSVVMKDTATGTEEQKGAILEQTIAVYDPTYDAVSKKLFNDSENFISFINSIFYPTADALGFKVRKVKVLNNESISDNLSVKSTGQVDSTKLIRFDYAYQCTCYAIDAHNTMKQESKYVFNLEMQRQLFITGLGDFNDRMLYYASRLFDTNASQQEMVPIEV